MEQCSIHIEQLKVTVNTASERIAYNLKDNIETFLQEVLLPKLDAYINQNRLETVPEIILEQLHFTINPSALDLNFDIERQFLDQIESKLIPLLNSNTATKRETLSDSSVRTNANSEQAILEFLNTGRFPWWFNAPKTASQMEALIYKVLDAKSFITKLLDALQNNSVKSRLIKQFPDGFLMAIINSATLNKNHKQLEALTKTYSALKKSDSSFRYLYWKLIFELTLEPKTEHWIRTWKEVLPKIYNSTASDAVKKAIALHEHIVTLAKNLKITKSTFKTFNTVSGNYLQDLDVTVINLIGKSPINTNVIFSESSKNEIKRKNNELLANKLKTKTSKDYESFASNKEPNSLDSFSTLGHNELTKLEGQANLEKISEASKNPTDLEHQTNASKGEYDLIQDSNFIEDPTKSAAIYTAHCGLLLLHPFLATFLKRCELISDSGKLTDKALVVQLLYYTATGQDKPYEHQTVFEKFLADYPIGIPLDRTNALPEHLKEKADNLIVAVLEHLPQLKSSSVALFRHEFLTRSGKLMLNTNHNKVIIARKSFDILLNSMPWNMSLIKLPWLKNRIHLDW